jgi:hypothetical protein
MGPICLKIERAASSGSRAKDIVTTPPHPALNGGSASNLAQCATLCHLGAHQALWHPSRRGAHSNHLAPQLIMWRAIWERKASERDRWKPKQLRHILRDHEGSY